MLTFQVSVEKKPSFPDMPQDVLDLSKKPDYAQVIGGYKHKGSPLAPGNTSACW